MAAGLAPRCARALVFALVLLANAHGAAAYLPDRLIQRDWHREPLGGPADPHTEVPQEQRQDHGNCRKGAAAIDRVPVSERRSAGLTRPTERWDSC